MWGTEHPFGFIGVQSAIRPSDLLGLQDDRQTQNSSPCTDPWGNNPTSSPNKIHHSLSISADCRGPVARIQLISAAPKFRPAAHFERSVSPSRAHAITSFLHPPRPAQWNVPETAHMPQGEPCTRLLLRGESMLRRQTRAKAFAWCKMPAPRLTGVGTTGSNSTWRALSTAFRSSGLACSCR